MWNEYVEKAKAFRELPEGEEWLYLGCSLVGEIGELINVLKKVMRGDKTLEESRSAIIEEMGGICWYSMMIMVSENDCCGKSELFDYDEKMSISGSRYCSKNKNVMDRGMSALMEFTVFVAGHVYTTIECVDEPMFDDMNISFCLKQVFMALDLDPQEVLDANIALLTERKAKNGTIKNHD